MSATEGPVCVSVINMKGGVGKTTVAALLSRYAALFLNRRVLAIDLDPQANLSQALMRESRYRQFLQDRAPSIVEVFRGYQPPSGHKASSSPLEVDKVLVPVGRNSISLIPSRFDFSDNLIEAIKPDPRVLASLIANSVRDKDLVIIDCAPTESILTQAAYHASRYVLVPVKPEYFATIGFPLLHDSLNSFKARNPVHQIDVIGVIVNNAFYDGSNKGGPERDRSIVEIKTEAVKNGWHIFRNEIPHSRGFPKMMRGDFRWPGNASEAYRRFSSEILKKMGLGLRRQG